MFELRSYQKDFIADIRNEFLKGHKRVCGVMPCGAGKTLAIAEITKKLAAEGKRVVFMVHRRELIEQTSKTFRDLKIAHGIIAANVESNYTLPVQIASVQTLINRLNKVAPPNFLIVDECHHIKAKIYKRIINKWDCRLLGLTATPIRMGGVTLHNSFDTLVVGSTVKELIEQGYLAHFDYYAPPSTIDFNRFRLDSYGDFLETDMSRELDRQDIIGDVIKYYRQYADGRQTIVYCINTHHSQHTADIFNRNGITACHVDYKTPPSERRDIIKKFRAGEITVLCNVNLFGEGFDVPNMDCVILTRPTKSFTLYYQQAMRALRPAPNKTAIIIDHVENRTRFPKLTDEINWTLDPNELQGTGIAPVKTCPECGTKNIPTGTRTCQSVIADRESILRCERIYNSLSIIYHTSTSLSRNGWLALADYKTDLCLEFIDKTTAIISDKKVKRRCIAEIIQRPYRAD